MRIRHAEEPLFLYLYTHTYIEREIEGGRERERERERESKSIHPFHSSRSVYSVSKSVIVSSGRFLIS